MKLIRTIKDVPCIPGVFQWQISAGELGRYDANHKAYLFDNIKYKYIRWLAKDWVDSNREYFISVRSDRRGGREPRTRR